VIELSTLLASLPSELTPSEPPRADPGIAGISIDSRAVAPGDLFVALRGENADGHEYLAQAAALGAVALLVDEAPKDPGLPPAVVVPDTRFALGPIARRFYGDPASELSLVGVTGTNGKTSTAFLVESILAAAGRRVGLIGTVEVRFGAETRRAINTTPESLELQRLLREMRTHGVDSAVMEVSSHGLMMGRVHGVGFDVAALTNLTQDHLDFHGDMDAYAEAKARLFRHHLKPGGTAVVSLDEPRAALFLEAARAGDGRTLGVSRRADSEAEIRVATADVSLSGIEARLELPGGTLDVTLPLVGDFNVENLIVAVGIAVGLGVPPDSIASGLAACPQVPGRMERVGDRHAEAPVVLVDYAHTPDAVEKLLCAVRPLTSGRVIAVFGCGGDRDRTKRPKMAEAVARFADLAVLTSDNPRTEDPDAILREVEQGLDAMQRVEPEGFAASERAYVLKADRREAIELAIAAARPSDSVVIAGKGHEDYQIVGRERLPFDDRAEARRALQSEAGRLAPERTGA
jgi:UDP-N-acetylmuramoyl-L-alanyl-D-glutamate--2,6-diaminopimelate ligase